MTREQAIEVIRKEYACVDAVSREAVQKEINCWIGSGEYRYAMSERFLIDRINDLPSVTQKSGKWINTADACMSDNIVCSKCGYNSIASYNYCPNCGAKMVEPQESEE